MQGSIYYSSRIRSGRGVQLGEHCGAGVLRERQRERERETERGRDGPEAPGEMPALHGSSLPGLWL